MTRFSRIAAVYCIAFGAAAGGAVVDIKSVEFDALRSGWLQMKVVMQCGRNTLEGARSERYVDALGVTACLAWEEAGDGGVFDFYRSEVAIVSMERGTDANVYFFLPGVVAERDRLPAEPFFHIVELTVGGRVLPLDEDGVSRRFRGDEAAVESLREKVRTEAARNRHILMPSYLAPVSAIGAQVVDEPCYLRREAGDGG